MDIDKELAEVKAKRENLEKQIAETKRKLREAQHADAWIHVIGLSVCIYIIVHNLG